MPFVGTYPLATSDGAETYLGLSSGNLVKRYPKPAGGASAPSYETRTAVATATILASVKTIRTDGYAVAGDGGDGFYKRRSGAPTLTANKAYIQSADGAWWELLPHGGRDVFLSQFGGKGDFAGVPGSATDNYTPLRDAIDFIARAQSAVELYTYRIFFGIGKFYIGQMVDIANHVWISGVSHGMGEAGATELHFPHTATCFVINQNNTTGDSGTGVGLPSGNASVLEGLSIYHHWSTGTFNRFDAPSLKHGIHVRCYGVTLSKITLIQMSGNGFTIGGSSGFGGADEGAPNSWTMRDCTVHSAIGDGLHVMGADANAGSCVGFSTMTEVGGAGIHNESYYTNMYTGLHLAGYGNRGVRVGNVVGTSRIYQLIGGAGSTTPNTTTPGTNSRIWYDIGVYLGGTNHDLRFPEYSSGGDYSHYHLPIWDSGGGSIYTGVYVENSTLMCHIQPPSMMIAVGPSSTMYSGHVGNGAFLSHRNGAGAYQDFVQGTTEYAANGSHTWVACGLPHESLGLGPSGGIGLLTFRRQADGDASWHWGYAAHNLDFRSPSGTQIWSITTRYSTRTFGRTFGVPYKLSLYDPVLEDITSSNNGRVLGNRAAQPTDAGEYARGDRWFNINPSPGGFEGWIVTTSGALHNVVWSNGVAVDGNTWLKNSANRVYRYISGPGTSTTQPVHTSGTVTGADGIAWTWVADGPPTFKQFGTIQA